jgi:hypothetical protein
MRDERLFPEKCDDGLHDEVGSAWLPTLSNFRKGGFRALVLKTCHSASHPMPAIPPGIPLPQLRCNRGRKLNGSYKTESLKSGRVQMRCEQCPPPTFVRIERNEIAQVLMSVRGSFMDAPLGLLASGG